MIRITDYQLAFDFHEVHEDAEMAIEFRRTLRVPDDGKVYVLPPSHRAFPLVHIDDCGQRVPEDWIERGGVVMPVYQAEAMYIAFSGGGLVRGYPCAVKIAAGMINAISGKPWKPELDAAENDYIVVPRQPRLDGFCIAMSTIRQFVAMKLGSGYSVEEQLTGKGEHGGIQIIVYPMKRDRYLRSFRGQSRWLWDMMSLQHFSQQHKEPPYFRRPRRTKMSLGAGGRMKQPIYKDPYGIEAWDQSVSSRCFAILANADEWTAITGQRPPTLPPTAKDYAAVGLPWFDYYAADQQTRPGSLPLTLVASVQTKADEKGEPLEAVGDVKPNLVVQVGHDEQPRASKRG
jgi:hypothetical protein